MAQGNFKESMDHSQGNFPSIATMSSHFDTISAITETQTIEPIE